MKARRTAAILLIAAHLVGLATKEAVEAEPSELYVPDGQLRSHLSGLMQGELWDVPWELVTLTGMSQAAFVGAEFWKPLAADTGPGAGRVPGGAAPGKAKEG